MAGLFDDLKDGAPDGAPSKQGLFDDLKAPTQNTSLLGDLGTDLKRGVQKLPGIATGLADIPVAALTNKRFVDETADKVGELTGFQPSQWAEEARDEYSSERQAGTAEIDQAWEEGSVMDVAGAYASNPGNVAGLVAESVPQMLAGGVLGRGALAAGRATGLVGAPTSAAQAATQGAIAGGVGEGAVIAGGTMDQIDDSVEPRRAAAAAAGAGVAGAALGVLGAKAAQRLGVLDAESAIAGGAGQVAGEAPGLARRVAGGALTEGVLEELPQSASETMIQNWAEEKDLTDGLARASVEGTLAGSAIGAGVNVLPRKRSEEMGLDPNAGPLSAAAVTAVDSEQARLPAPERLALPAPDQTLYADGQGNVSEQGPARDVDREQRPVPGREQPVRDFGPGMDQQVERGTVPVTGELMPAAQNDAPVQESAEPRTFDAQPERQGIPDLRESSINVDAEGNAVPGKIPTPRQADYVQGGRGMDQQAPVGKTYSNVLAAKNAIQRAGSTDVLEAVQVGPKQFEVRAIAPPAASQEAPAVEPAPVQPPAADAVIDAPAAAPVAKAAPAPTAKPAAVKPAPQPVDRKGLPEILRHPKKMVITRMAKAAGIKKGSPGYDAAVGRLESEYERQVDDAQAALPFEQFNALNKESPEGVNRQAWTQLRKERGIETADVPAATKVKPIKGADIDGDWASFSKDSGTLSVPRAEMPQIKAEHRGAMVNFLNARDIAHAEETIAADQLKPTQAEYSTKKVEAAKAFEGGDRSILISRDGHVLDGHHQWLAKRDAGEDVKVIRLDAPIRQLLDTVAEFPSATVDEASAPAAKVEDFGEKIGGARKDTATQGKKKAAKEADSRPAWQRRYEVTQVVTSTVPGEAGRWVISDTRKLDWNKRPKQLRGNYATEEEAMQMLPVIAVAQKHRVLSVRDGDGTGFEIWRDVTDRKRVKVVDQVFPSREAGMEYMARNAKAIIETNTTFGEADLPRPDSTVRQGAERRTGPVKDSAFTEAFGFRGVEFGNWNNQEERQQLLDDAYDGLMDLAEVMGIPPRAISLNGDLALAFGARGQGLSGARAHYEPGKVVINLTKMNGAGSLAHEWFHALDHYFARQDGKSSSAWAVDKDGTRSLKIASNFENDAASSGFLRNNSGVREELRDAYTDLMKTMFSKGETYVEDTARVDEFVGRSRKEVTDRLDEIRRDLAEQKDPRYWKRNNKPASAEQLAEFDTVAQLVRDGTALSTELRPTPGKSRSVLTSMRWTNDALEKMSEIYKAVRGRTGFNAENNGVFDRLRQTMGAYSSRLKMLADAQNGQEKVKKVPTQFAMDAKELDQGRGTDYWTTPHEMAARAFQGYVEDKIAERGGQSPFLNFGPENVGILTPWGWKRPFPAGEERQSINRAFDKLIGVIQTRETEGGNIAMYRLSPEQASGIPLFSARAIAAKVSKATGLQIETVANEAGLPAAVQAQIKRDGVSGRVAGVYHNGTSYLIASNLRDTKHAVSTVLHEAVGHGGVKAVLGNRINPVMRGIYRDMPAAMKRELERRYAGQTANLSAADAQVLIAEEYVAHLAETDPKNGIIERLVAMLRQFIRATFGDSAAMKWTRNDLVQLLAEARQAAGAGGTDARYRQSAAAEALAALPDVSEVSEAEFVESLSDQQANSFARAIYKARGTDSPFFQRWFGKSRMVDKQGQPIAFVHRSYGERDTFDDADLGKNTGTPTAALGHFLARKDVGNVDRYGPVVEQFYIRMAKPKVVTQDQFEAMGDWSLVKVKAYRKTLMGQGYDGLYIQGLAWPVVFEGKNIKAKRNAGTFNESASARYNVNDQTKTPAFVRWFGDWQAARAEARLDAMQPITIRTPAEWRGLSVVDLRSRVAASLEALGDSGKPLQHPEIGDVKIVKRGIGKALSASADPAKLLVLGDLRKAFEGSIYASSKPAEGKPNVMGYDKLLARVNIDGQDLVAVLTVETLRNGQQFYNAVTLNDGQKKAPVASPRDTPIAGERATSANTGTSGFVRRELDRVNPDTVSKVVDADGRPLIVYRGSSKEFTGIDGGEAFFTDSQAAARTYGRKVKAVYLNFKNPMVIDYYGREDSDIVFDIEDAREAGHDGLIVKNAFDGRSKFDQYVAFESGQIKSATDNNGDFDPASPDIRYSLNDEAATTDALRKLGLGGKDADGVVEQIRNMTLGGLKAKLSEWTTRSEEGLFDGLVGIRRAEEAVGVTDAEKQGYVSARMASGIADVMHGVLHYAAPEWRDGVIAGKADTRGVLEILGDLGQDNLTPWLAWLGGKRAQMLKAQGRENNLTDTEIAELIAMGKGKEALFEKVYQDYAKVNEAVLDLAEQAGLIDQSARAKWATEYYVPFYRVDESEGLFSGPRSKKGLSHQSAAIKALKGGTLPTNDLLTNMLAGWTKRIDASMKNKALLEVVDNLQGSQYLTDESPRYQQVLISRSQIADQIRKDRKALAMAAEMLGLPAESKFLKVANQLMKPENEGFEQLWTRVAPTDPDIIRVQRDGKNEYYRVNDESLLRGLKFMEGSVFNDPITRIGRTFKRLLTTGVTASPDFILRNFIRDAAHAWMINKDGFVLGKDSIKGMRDALREDQDYRDLMFAGGSFQGGYVHGTDPEASAQIIRRALEKKGFTSEQQSAYLGSLVNTPAKVAGMLGKGWQAYRTLGDKVENANRLSTYKAALAAGKSPRQAAYEAKDLMDYSLRGNFAAAQWFTDVVPFLNARMQGLYKLGRAVKGDKTLIAKEVAMKGGYIALFSLLLAGLNDDDERYRGLKDWDKDMNWHIFLGDQHFRIPKPFELGLVFGTVPERLLHALTGTQDGGDLAKAVSHGVFQTLAFNPVPQFYQPIRELQANRNFFHDSPIEDMSDEGKLPEARFDERTSAIGRVLGQVTGPTLGLSPKQLDHLVQGYTGTLGGYVLGMSSLIASAFDGVDSPTTRASDLPVLKVLYQGDAVRSTQYQSEFYDMMQEADQLHRTVKAYRDEGKVEAAAKLLEGNSDKLKHRPALGLARQQLGAVRRQMDAVYRDTAMDGDAKRRRLEELQTRSNQIAERVVRLAGKDF
ncbi:hypothetical protein LJR071_003571 [Pseudomonas sp. LjRoot71]|uniref:LPD38 domain-containing protein n=1 Tax=Pseudomonas sp. LjRoot71 TaxID=3342336 RepID=UPI003ED1343D